MKKAIKRCPWVNLNNVEYVKYHDEEWGRPVYNDVKHFEMLTLEGAQAGLSWQTILKKRDNYRKAFSDFDPQKVAKFNKRKVEQLMNDEGIVRNRLKIESTISNAKSFLKIQKEYDSFNSYIWSFVNNKPIRNKFKKLSDYPAQTELSLKISKDLKKNGFRFVGPVIVYSYLQAVGIVNDHVKSCFLHGESNKKRR